MNVFRNIAVIVGYALLAVVGLTGNLFVEPPSPIAVVAPTEAQIKDQVKHERKQARIDRAITAEIAAARSVFLRVGPRRCADFSVLTGRTAYEFGIPARLLAAVIVVESGCNPQARSGRDSLGIMQVNPRIWGHRNQLADPAYNLHFGARILAGYIRQFGLVEGLHHYNGLADKSDDYARRVLAAGEIVWPS